MKRIKISKKADAAKLGAMSKIERPFEIHDVELFGEVAQEEGVKDGTAMVLFIVVSENGFTSKKGNKYDKGTYWYSKPQE